MTDLVEDFYGVYLLYNVSDKYKGRVYIGFTVDPNRRINQHNKGVRSGGARKTSCKGPWEMVLIVHGFPNEISALRFEWAWQNPKKSRRLRHLVVKKGREKVYDYTLRVLSEMLRTGPWKRLPLTIRWLNEKHAKDFPANMAPPLHMPIVYGQVTSKKLPNTPAENSNSGSSTSKEYCYTCYLPIQKDNLMMCVNPKCTLKCHVLCFSKYFCNDSEILPVEGDCPSCDTHLLWGDVVRKKKGCYKNLEDEDFDEVDY